MPRTFVMTSGAVIDAEGRTVVSGRVDIYDAETGGTLVSPAALRQADGTAWPIEGVKSDSNGKVKVQWPDTAGDPPAVLYADSARGRWEMLPLDLSQRLTTLEESGVGGGGGAAEIVDREVYAEDTAYAKGDRFTWQGGVYIVSEDFTGDAEPDLTKTIFMGADASAAQVSLSEDEDADTFTVAFLLESGKYGVLTGTRSDAPTGGGSGGSAGSDWATRVILDHNGPWSTKTSLAADFGSIPFVNAEDGSAFHERNSIVTMNGVAGVAHRGTTSAWDATLGTAVPLEPDTGNFTVRAILIRRLTFDVGLGGSKTAIGTIGTGAASATMYGQIVGSALKLGVLVGGPSGVDFPGTPLSTSASQVETAYALPGDGYTGLTTALSGGWHVLCLALKGTVGKLYLDGTVVASGITTTGLADATNLDIRSFYQTGADWRGGVAWYRHVLGGNMTEPQILAMQTAMLAAAPAS